VRSRARVLSTLEVGEHVAHLAAIEELGPAHHLEWDAAGAKRLLERTGLAVGPVEDGDVVATEDVGVLPEEPEREEEQVVEVDGPLRLRRALVERKDLRRGDLRLGRCVALRGRRPA
jgi:hypothetical protein